MITIFYIINYIDFFLIDKYINVLLNIFYKFIYY